MAAETFYGTSEEFQEALAEAGADGNVYDVPAKQWKKWSEHARLVFNQVYRTLTKNQSVVVHRQAEPISEEHWQVLSFNTAWLAASAVDENA